MWLHFVCLIIITYIHLRFCPCLCQSVSKIFNVGWILTKLSKIWLLKSVQLKKCHLSYVTLANTKKYKSVNFTNELKYDVVVAETPTTCTLSVTSGEITHNVFPLFVYPLQEKLCSNLSWGASVVHAACGSCPLQGTGWGPGHEGWAGTLRK